MASYKMNVAAVKGLSQSVLTDGGKSEQIIAKLADCKLIDGERDGVSIEESGSNYIDGVYYERRPVNVTALDDKGNIVANKTESIRATPWRLFLDAERLETYDGGVSTLAGLGRMLAYNAGLGIVCEPVEIDLYNAAIDILQSLPNWLTTIQLRRISVDSFAATSSCVGKYTPIFTDSDSAIDFINKTFGESHAAIKSLNFKFRTAMTVSRGSMILHNDGRVQFSVDESLQEHVMDYCRQLMGWRGGYDN